MDGVPGFDEEQRDADVVPFRQLVVLRSVRGPAERRVRAGGRIGAAREQVTDERGIADPGSVVQPSRA
jgi:hypothetical protein